MRLNNHFRVQERAFHHDNLRSVVDELNILSKGKAAQRCASAAAQERSDFAVAFSELFGWMRR
jgi:hypothetical protein